jgi:preprotein translocase subunit YajC
MFLSIAYAMPAPGGEGGQSQGGIFGMLIPIALMILIFYFFIIRPQSKRQQDHNKMLADLKRGDEVVTTGGIIGRIHAVTDAIITLEVGQNMRIRVLKRQIAGRYESEKPAESS